MENYGRNESSKSASEAHSRGVPVLGSAGIGRAGGCEAAPQQTPLLGVTVQQLAENIERLQHTMGALHSKLEPVLYSEPPKPATTGQAVSTRQIRASCDLGNAINALADQVENINDHANALIRRCEL